MKSIIFNLIKHIASITSGLGSNKKLFILIYHRVLDKPDCFRSGEVDIERFSQQMELLAEYFNVLSLNEAMSRLQNDSLPPRAVCITFDDGYADNYFNALPILKANGLLATFFISTGFVNGGRMWNDSIIETIRNIEDEELDLTKVSLGKFDISTMSKKAKVAHQIIQKVKYFDSDSRESFIVHIESLVKSLPDDLMLTTDQLKKLHDSGMEIGGHTVNHPIIANLKKEELENEILENKSTLEEMLDFKIRYFAYPNGKPNIDYRPEQVQVVRDLGYEAAFSTQWGVAQNIISDEFQMPRFTPWDITPGMFMLRMVKMYSSVN